MPEIPDLEAYRVYFNKRLPGLRVQQTRVFIPVVVRAATSELDEAVRDKAVIGVERIGKYLLFSFEDAPLLVVHPMLTGRFQYCPPVEKKRARTIFMLALDNGMELRYFDDRLMGKVYLAYRDELAGRVPRWAEMGPDALSPELTEPVFLQRLKPYRGQIKSILTKEQCIAGIGNAYSDEILFEAGIHPYRKRTEISEEAQTGLYRAMHSVFGWATPIVTERMEKEGLPANHYRDHLRVHRRGGQLCPRCGATISEITAGQRITSFCRNCQK